MTGAPRRLLCSWRASARGVRLGVCFWLMLSGLSAPVAAQIVEARYDAPTTRYAHGVLGDAVEWGALVLTLGNGRVLRAVLPDHLVFEDLAPRLADLDGDGDAELVVVESSQTGGGRLAVWDETGRIAATPHIGQRNRWLAPAGIADLDGDGAVEIAYVDRPHLAKVLRVVRFRAGSSRLQPVAALAGFSNHRIGWDYILGDVRDCGSGPEVILSDGAWTTVMAVRLDGATLRARGMNVVPDRAGIERALRCR